jgi:hypothetical protein
MLNYSSMPNNHIFHMVFKGRWSGCVITCSNGLIHECLLVSIIWDVAVSRLCITVSQRTGFVTRLTWWVQLVKQELLTLPEHMSSPPVFSGVSCYSIFSFMCMLCWSLFVFLNFWSLCFLFFDLRILITPLISSNSSYV